MDFARQRTTLTFTCSQLRYGEIVSKYRSRQLQTDTLVIHQYVSTPDRYDVACFSIALSRTAGIRRSVGIYRASKSLINDP